MSDDAKQLHFIDNTTQHTDDDWFKIRVIEALGSYSIPTFGFTRFQGVQYVGDKGTVCHTADPEGLFVSTLNPYHRLPWVVVDVGANVGAFSYLAAQFANDVRCYEPCKQTYERLKLNLDKYLDHDPGQQLQCFNLAVGKESGHTVYMHPSDSQLSGDAYSSAEDTSGEPVETISLEDIVISTPHNQIDYLKVDCEGAEYDLLLGKDLARVGYIAVETHCPPDGSPDRREELISHLGQTHNLDIKRDAEGNVICINALNLSWMRGLALVSVSRMTNYRKAVMTGEAEEGIMNLGYDIGNEKLMTMVRKISLADNKGEE